MGLWSALHGNGNRCRACAGKERPCDPPPPETANEWKAVAAVRAERIRELERERAEIATLVGPWTVPGGTLTDDVENAIRALRDAVAAARKDGR